MKKIYIYLFLILAILGCKKNNLTTEIKLKEKEYSKIFPISNDVRLVQIGNKFGAINTKNNKLIFEEKFDYIVSSKNYLIVKNNNKFGVLTKTGKEVIPLKYDGITELNKDLFKIKIDNKYALLNKNNLIISNYYDEMEDIEHGILRIVSNKKMGILGIDGKEIVNPHYKYIDKFTEDTTTMITNDNKLKFIKITGETLDIGKYENYPIIQDGVAIVLQNNKYGIIDKNGKEIIPLKYENIRKLSTFRYAATLNRENFLIDIKKMKISNLKDKIPYTEVNEIITVLENGKYGFLNKEGEEIISPMYDEVGYFKNGVAIVSDFNSECYKLINDNNQEITSKSYLYFRQRVGDYFIYGIEDGTEGILYKNGDEIIKAEYEKLVFLGENISIGKKGNKLFYIVLSKNKVEIYSFLFKDVIYYTENEIAIKENDGIKIIKISSINN